MWIAFTFQFVVFYIYRKTTHGCVDDYQVYIDWIYKLLFFATRWRIMWLCGQQTWFPNWQVDIT